MSFPDWAIKIAATTTQSPPPRTRRAVDGGRLRVIVAAILIAYSPAGAQTVREMYSKQEVMIPMRDGVKLFTAIYTPKDTGQPYPIMLLRTPYSVGPYGPDAYKGSLGPSPLFTKEGYTFAY